MKKNLYDVVTIGSATRDIMFETNEHTVFDVKKPYKHTVIGFTYRAKIHIDEVSMTTGGGACNTAVNFSRLGYRAAVLSAIGKDSNGMAVLDKLQKENVETKFIMQSKTKNTGFATIVTTEVKKEKEHIIFHHQGVTEDIDITLSQLKKLNPSIIFTCSLRVKKWKNILKNIGLYKKERKALADKNKAEPVLLAWNPGGRQLCCGVKGLSSYLKLVDILLVNREEAMELLTIKKTKNIFKLLDDLYHTGPQLVVITDGQQGAYAYDGIKHYHIPMYIGNVKAVDTTGVGDAFGSTFTFAYKYYDGDIKKAMTLAAINAAHVSGTIGAQNGALKRNKLLQILKKIK